MNEKRSYYEFGKFISEGANVGTVRDALKNLQEELEGPLLSAPNEATASKMRKVYELYIIEYGFDIEELEEISALDLYRAQSNAFKMERDRSDAYNLIVRLNDYALKVHKFENGLKVLASAYSSTMKVSL